MLSGILAMVPRPVNELTPVHTYLNAGNYEVSVDLIFSNGSNQTLIQEIQIDTAVINFSALPNICTNAGTLVLNQGSPTGGTYSGPGVDSGLGLFNPQITGVGTFTIDYTYTNSNGCMSTEQQMNQCICPTYSDFRIQLDLILFVYWVHRLI